MTEQEAIAQLGLTARTLRNYRRKGRLAYREVKGKTRPVIEYDTADIDRLKAELDRQRQQSKKPEPVAPVLPRLTFGLPPAEYAELAQAAEKVGMTPGEYARRIARESMESHYLAEAKDLRAELAAAKAEMRRMREEFASAIEVVLCRVGLSPDAAATWVTQNLR